MARRKKGEGTVRLRKDGRWEGRLIVGYDEEGHAQKKSVTAPTRVECLMRLETLKEECGGAVGKLKAEMPFGEWLEFWFHTYSKPKLRPTTQLTYWNQIKLHIVPSIGKIALNRLTQKDLQQFYATLKKHGRLKDTETKGSELSNRVVRSCHSLCRMALEKAIEDGLIRKNPAIGCTLPPKQAREMQVLMKEEIERFLIQADEAGCYEFFLLELVTGMRRGELLGLKWSDLNFRTGELHISRQLTTMGFSTPKTKSSIRSILLPGDMVDLLSKMKQKSVSEWMFPSPVKKDMPRDPSAILNLFHRLLERAGCRQVRFHDLRHTFATLALENGMDIKTLSATIGHVSTETTLNIYAHVTDTMRQQAAVKIDQEIGGVSAPLPPNSRCEPILAEEQQEPAENKKTPCQTEIQTTWRKKRKPGTGCVTMINDHLYEGRYTPNVNGKRIARNVYANTREECEEKLAALIKEMQKEIAEMRTASAYNLAPTL